MESLTLTRKDQILEEMPKETILTYSRRSTHSALPASAGFCACYARFFVDESGQDLIEYALVAALIGVAVVVALNTIGNKIGTSFNTVGNNLTNAI
jgi:pilus assembly protein Flp/PilA